MAIIDLASRHCRPCRGDEAALPHDRIVTLREELDHGWEVVDNRLLRKSYRFEDFASALAFAHRIGEVADAEDHHPDLHIGWGRASVELWTHSIGALSENDFIMAAKIESLR